MSFSLDTFKNMLHTCRRYGSANLVFYIYLDKNIDKSIANGNVIYTNIFNEMGVNKDSIELCGYIAKEIIRLRIEEIFKSVS